jgi:cytochrome b subunit of formate dehydrogenase
MVIQNPAPTPAMTSTTRRIRRTSRSTRLLHTAVYLTTSALLFTGLWLLIGGEGRPSPVARIVGEPDTSVHIWLGRVLAVVLVLPLLVRWRGTIVFVRETFRFDRGDGRWWLNWPRGALTGRFARHEGHFDPGQRAANLVMVGGLLVLTVTGIGMTVLHGGPMFAWMSRVHTWTTYVVTIVIAGHLFVAIGILPGYRGAWRAMHLGGRVSKETAKRLWPAWLERSNEHRSERKITDPPPSERADKA